jgi:hypothetical protein
MSTRNTSSSEYSAIKLDTLHLKLYMLQIEIMEITEAQECQLGSHFLLVLIKGTTDPLIRACCPSNLA